MDTNPSMNESEKSKSNRPAKTGKKNRRHGRGKPKGGLKFNPKTANTGALAEQGFIGKLLRLGKAGRRPSVFKFVNATTKEEVVREFPCGLCQELERVACNRAKRVAAPFDPATASLLDLGPAGFRGRVLELGEVGGKPTLIEFRHSTTDQTVVRKFPRGMCNRLEEGYILQHGAKMRQSVGRSC